MVAIVYIFLSAILLGLVIGCIIWLIKDYFKDRKEDK
jgi:hypothetical protein